MADPYVVLFGLPAVAAWVPVACLLGARAGGVDRRGQTQLAGVLGAWIAATGLLAWAGVLDQWEPPPPAIPVLLAGVVLTVLLVRSPRAVQAIDRLPLAALVAFHTFRFPLELVMHEAARVGIMPPQMTWTGWNLDVLTGLTAPFVALGVWRGWLGARAVAVWNLLGSALLLTIVVVAISSTPTFGAFGRDAAHLNTWIARVPYVWLPTVCVLGAFGGHLAIAGRLRRARAV